MFKEWFYKFAEEGSECGIQVGNKGLRLVLVEKEEKEIESLKRESECV